MSDTQSEKPVSNDVAREQDVALTDEEIIQAHLEDVNDAFAEVGFLTRLKRMCKGLGMPRASAEYKRARTDLKRLAAPLLAIICPIVFIVVLCVFTEISGRGKETIQVDIAQSLTDEDALTEEVERQDLEQPDETEIEITVDTPNDMPTQVTDVITPPLTSTSVEQTLKQPDPTSVSLIKSPVSMKSIYGETRSAASRAAAMRKYGGDRRTEESVINALRWLKTGRNTRPMLLKMAFQTMALKSARMSGIEPSNLAVACNRLKEGFLIQGNKKDGGFSSDYYGPPRANYRRTGIWHSMVGVIGLQYLGAGEDPIVEKTMKILDDDWEMPTLGSIDSSCCPVRGNYWATMVFFNGGGKRWRNWNLHMIDTYYQGQTVLRNAYTDTKGVKRNMGYWRCEDMHIGTQPVASTCWVALQLMVYYRYLPTSAKEARGAKPRTEKPAEPARETKPAVEIEVDI